MAPKLPPSTAASRLLFAACLVIVIAGLKAAATLILPFLVSLFLSMSSVPLLNYLLRKRVPRSLAVLTTFAVVIGIFLGLGLFVGSSLGRFTQDAPKYQERLGVFQRQALAWFQSHGLFLHGIDDELLDAGMIMDLASRMLLALAAILSNAVLVLLTTGFLLAEAAVFPEKVRLAFGESRASDRLTRARREVAHYLGYKTLVSLATGILVWAVLAIIGVDYAVLWGTLAFLFNYIPNLGSILAALPPTLLAWLQLGTGRAIAVVVAFVVINFVIGNLIEPQLMGRRLGLSTLVVFLSLVFWGWMWGPIGMLLSVPLTMVLKLRLENTPELRWMAVFLDSAPSTVMQAEPEPEPEPSEPAGDTPPTSGGT